MTNPAVTFLFVVVATTIVVVSATESSRQPLRFKNLVLEGGGFKGISYIGAFKSLAKHGYYDYEANRWNFENITGTSIGCVFSFFLALNISPEKMEKIAYGINYETIFDSDLLELLDMPTYRDTYIFSTLNYIDLVRRFVMWSVRFLQHWTLADSPGLDTGAAIENWIFDVVVRQYAEPAHLRDKITRDMSLREFYNLVQKDTLFTCLSAQLIKVKILRFNALESPHVSLSDALLSSIALPVLFKPFGANDYTNRESYPVVDGGVFNNFPIYDYDFAGELSRQTLGLSLHQHPNTNSITTALKTTYDDYCYKNQHDKSSSYGDGYQEECDNLKDNIIYSKYFVINTYKFFRYITSAIIGSRWYIQYSTDPRNCNRIVYLDSPLHLLGTSKRGCIAITNDNNFDKSTIKRAIFIAEKNTNLFMNNYKKIKCDI